MIDLHCHLLPAVDDGPGDLTESVAMARAALRDGVRTIVATPHGTDWGTGFAGGSEALSQWTSDLESELARRGLELRVLPGLEVYLTPETPELHQREQLSTLNSSRYMLVEFPFHILPVYAEQTLFQLRMRHVAPLIAHPERNATIARNPETLRSYVERGMLVQVTAGSLTGFFGPEVRRAAEYLVAHRMAHVIASDAHSSSARPPVLSAGVKRATELIGEQEAIAMVTSTPDAIVSDREVAVLEPLPSRQRSWFPFGNR